MKVSVVITTYNRLSFLKKAVASALQQTYPCEVIIVDDGSSDGTETYAKNLGSQVIYHRNAQNLGHADSVNAGVAVATGDWIKFIDDDDYLKPHCIEEMVKAITSRPQAAICSAQAIQVDEHGKELSCTPTVLTGKEFYVLQEDIHYGMLLDLLPFGTPVQVAVKKTAFLQSGGWNSEFNCNCDDIESWVKIAEFGDAIFINQPLASRTIWSDNVSGKLSLQDRLEANLKIKQKIYERVHSKYADSLPKSEDVRAFLELYWGLVGIKNGKLLDGMKLLYPSLRSPTGFARIAQLLYARRNQKQLTQFDSETREETTVAARDELRAAQLPWPKVSTTLTNQNTAYTRIESLTSHP